MVFTENQVTHFYVVNSAEVKKDSTKLKDAGAACVGTTADGQTSYIQVMGPNNELLRSALIKKCNIMSVKLTDAAQMDRPLVKKVVKFAEGVNVKEGETYTVHLMVRQYGSISDESVLVKTAAKIATSGMTKAQLMTGLAESFRLNFLREENAKNLVKITAKDDTLEIEELEQKDWNVGTFEDVPVYFEVYASDVAGQTWIDKDSNKPQLTTNKVGNGKKIADMEYFFLGERGDIYRNVGWPNVIKTFYQVNPTKKYHTLNIHFSYIGNNESVQKSEQEIMLVSTDKTALTTIAKEVVKNTDIKVEYDEDAEATTGS